MGSAIRFSPEQLLASDFQTAARAVLQFLGEKLGFGLWMVTRVSGDDWIVLEARDRGYGVAGGDVFRWSDSFCSRMVLGLGPRIAPDASVIPAYADAPIGKQVPIGAYVGVPIQSGDEMFGTLCAIDPNTMSRAIEAELPLVELLAGLLGNILLRERDVDAERRRAERAEVDAMTDALTGLTNRRGWDVLVEREESRAARYGDAMSVCIVDLDDLKHVNDAEGHDAGDQLLRQAAQALRCATRESDVVARLGGDEFGVMLTNCGAPDVSAAVGRMYSEFSQCSVRASIGSCTRLPSIGLRAAIAKADQLMLAEKASRKAGRDAA